MAFPNSIFLLRIAYALFTTFDLANMTKKSLMKQRFGNRYLMCKVEETFGEGPNDSE